MLVKKRIFSLNKICEFSLMKQKRVAFNLQIYSEKETDEGIFQNPLTDYFALRKGLVLL